MRAQRSVRVAVAPPPPPPAARPEPRVRPAGGHDLLESLSRVNKLQDIAEIRFGAPDTTARSGARGWWGCAEILGESEGFGGWQETLARWLVAEYGQAPERTSAGYLKAWYLLAPAFLGALLFHHERRVPSLRPEDLWFRVAEDGRPHPDGIALNATGFACLADDPAAGTPETTVVASEHALAALLRARYLAHAARFVKAYSPGVRFGPRSLWGAVTDALDVALWRAGRLGGDEGAGVADAALVLPERLAPFTSASTLHSRCDEDGHAGWTRRKESCCFNYLLAQGKGPCSTCPRVVPKR